MTTHLRVSDDQGNVVRTFCNKLARRSYTKTFRKVKWIDTATDKLTGATLRDDDKITCVVCQRIGRVYAAGRLKTPATLRRVRKLTAQSPQLYAQPAISATDEALKLLAQAQLAGEEMGEAINKKHRDVERAVGRAAAAIASQKRKLRIAQTFLKKAEQRHARLVKKLAKTPKFTPQKEDDDDQEQATDDDAFHPSQAEDQQSAGSP